MGMRPAPQSFLPLAVAAALGAVACGEVEIKPDSKSGEDFERAGAKQLFLDKLADDYISPEKGDATDWKFLKIPSKGILKLVVFWDTKSVQAITEVRDRFGVMIQNFTHSSELEKDELEFPVEPGTHFIRLFSSKGGSVYTTEAVFQPFDMDATDEIIPEKMGGDDLLGEPIPDAAPMSDAQPRRGGGGGARRPPGPGPRPDPVPSGAALDGTLFRVLPSPNGKGTQLTINLGSEKGVNIGDKGKIVCATGGDLPNGGFQVTKVSAKSSQAFASLQHTQIGSNCRDVKVFPRAN
jgi:hypothetical protein